MILIALPYYQQQRRDELLKRIDEAGFNAQVSASKDGMTDYIRVMCYPENIVRLAKIVGK